LSGPLCDRETARLRVIPAPFEATTSYGRGAANGPRAIIEASCQVELFDGISTPAQVGVATDRAVDFRDAASSPEALARIEQRVRSAVAGGAVPVLLGGEHTVSVAGVRALLSAGVEFGVIQFDAHADLRASYGGTPWSHACVARRLAELGPPIFQVGVRSWSEEEEEVRGRLLHGRLDAAEIARGGVPETVLPPDFPANIYVSFDVDVLDPSLVPATGAPEPGGLFWYDALDALRSVVNGRSVVGLDAVELAPIAGCHSSDFTVAKLVYAVMGFIARSAAWPAWVAPPANRLPFKDVE